MSDRELPGFDVAVIADAVRQPPLDVIESAARARRRRRARGGALAVVVVLAGMVALPMAAGTHRFGGTEETPEVRDRTTRLVMTGPGSGVGAELIEHGCTVSFTYTDDVGRSWDSGAASYTAIGCRSGIENRPADHPHLAYAVLGQRSYLVLDDGRNYLSTDYGRTWRDAEQAMVPVPAFPPQARVVFCQAGCDALRQPLAVDPSTGTVYRLSGEPASPYPPFSVYPSADGTIWVTYWPEELNGMAVGRSVDRGATWNTWQPPKGANVTAVVGVDEREAYLLIEPSPPAGAPPMDVMGPAQLLVTRDGGSSWQDVGTDLPAASMIRPATLGSDGSLLVVQPGEITPTHVSSLLVSRDGGRHFSSERPSGGQDGAADVAPGYAWLHGRDDMSVTGPDHVIVTRDGSSWTRFDLPR